MKLFPACPLHCGRCVASVQDRMFGLQVKSELSIMGAAASHAGKPLIFCSSEGECSVALYSCQHLVISGSDCNPARGSGLCRLQPLCNPGSVPTTGHESRDSVGTDHVYFLESCQFQKPNNYLYLCALEFLIHLYELSILNFILMFPYTPDVFLLYSPFCPPPTPTDSLSPAAPPPPSAPLPPPAALSSPSAAPLAAPPPSAAPPPASPLLGY